MKFTTNGKKDSSNLTQSNAKVTKVSYSVKIPTFSLLSVNG